MLKLYGIAPRLQWTSGTQFINKWYIYSECAEQNDPWEIYAMIFTRKIYKIRNETNKKWIKEKKTQIDGRNWACEKEKYDSQNIHTNKKKWEWEI